jgi:hypothetical protein
MDTNLNLSDFVGRWKSYTARELSKRKIIEEPQVWQSGFFDRLLRNENEWGEKYQYMLQNPVRAGLVSKTTDWPYKGSLQL